MTVTLNIENQKIRLVSRKANQVDYWETLELPSGMINNGTIQDRRGVAAILKEHFQAAHLPTQQVRVCLTGLSFVYRVLTLPNIKPDKLKSAVERATQKEIALPLDNLYLDWQVIRRGPTDMEIFVLGIARPMVDDLLGTLKEAGLRIQSLELKALALARAAAHSEALIVDCEPGTFEILVVRDGVPVTIHRVSPKNEMFTFEDHLNQMMTELNRIIDFFNVNHPDKPLTQATPVMLSGSLCDDPRSLDLITRAIGHQFDLFNSSLKLSSGFPVSTYAANLGLLIHDFSGRNSGTTSSIDLIQARRRNLSRQPSARQLWMAGALVIALILLAGVWKIHQQAVDQSYNLKLKALNLNNELVRANQELENINLIQNQITTLNDETRQLQEEREELGGRGELAEILRAITENLPYSANFNRITTQPDKIMLEGTAVSRQDIVNYVHNLEKKGLFAEVRIALIDTSRSSTGVDAYTFRIVMER